MEKLLAEVYNLQNRFEVQQRGLGDLLSRLDDLVERFEKVVDKLELTLYVEGGDEE